MLGGLEAGATERWGEFDGRAVVRVLLESSTGASALVSNYGASLLALCDRSGANVVLGYDTLEEYVSDPHYLGVTVGRVANRIARGTFEFAGQRVQLPLNDPPDHHHGGTPGFGKRVWAMGDVSARAVTFRLHSPDGDSGYPGALDASVTYALDGDSLTVTMEADARGDTLVNLVNHAYFNLEESGDVLDHELELAASYYTPATDRVPDGTVLPVSATALDFRTRTRIGARLPRPSPGGAPPGYDHDSLPEGAEEYGARSSAGELPGYDHGFLLDGAESYTAASSVDAPLRYVGTVRAPRSGRTLSIASNQPAVQLYTANFFDGRGRSSRGPLERHLGLCLETQALPNAINVPAWRPMVLLPRGARYRHVVVYTLGG